MLLQDPAGPATEPFLTFSYLKPPSTEDGPTLREEKRSGATRRAPSNSRDSPDVAGLGLSGENRKAVVECVNKRQGRRSGRPVFGARPIPPRQPTVTRRRGWLATCRQR